MKTLKVRANQDFISTIYGNVSEGQIIPAMPEDMFEVLSTQEPPLVTDITPVTIERPAKVKKTAKAAKSEEKAEDVVEVESEEAAEDSEEVSEATATELAPAPRQRSSAARTATPRKKAGE
jgi:hypothetical protein